MVSNIFHFHPYLGKISNLTNIFQMGWNHQLGKEFGESKAKTPPKKKKHLWGHRGIFWRYDSMIQGCLKKLDWWSFWGAKNPNEFLVRIEIFKKSSEILGRWSFLVVYPGRCLIPFKNGTSSNGFLMVFVMLQLEIIWHTRTTMDIPMSLN